MSAEAEVTDALQQPVAQNAQSTEDVKSMLAELEGDTSAKTENKTNGEAPTEEPSDSRPSGTAEDDGEGTSDKKDEDSPRQTRDRGDRSPEQRRGDRYEGRGRGRGRGRGGRGGRGGFMQHDRRQNIKSDVTTQDETDDPKAIRKQTEFYFSDSNLPRDQFLLTQVGGSRNNPVELKILHTFKRMRHFQPFEAIVEAMRDSTFLELCEDDTCVRRREPLPASLDNGPDPNVIEIFEDKAMPRSVYAKGFGEEVASTQFDIENFFGEHGTTNLVRLRRSDDKAFKGSVFVEFDTEETAEKFLALEPKPQYKGKDLQIMSKKAYCDNKVEDIKAGRIQANTQYPKRSGRDDRFGGRDRDHKRKRDNEDDRDWRVRRDEDRRHGFKDDRRPRRGEPDYTKGGKPKYEKVERDDKGIPVVKETIDEDSKAKRDAAKVDALAKAKATVDAQNRKDGEKQDGADEAEAVDQNGDLARKEAVEPIAGSIVADTEATTSKKREREDDEGDAERELKKVDTKTEVETGA